MLVYGSSGYGSSGFPSLNRSYNNNALATQHSASSRDSVFSSRNDRSDRSDRNSHNSRDSDRFGFNSDRRDFDDFPSRRHDDRQSHSPEDIFGQEERMFHRQMFDEGKQTRTSHNTIATQHKWLCFCICMFCV